MFNTQTYLNRTNPQNEEPLVTTHTLVASDLLLVTVNGVEYDFAIAPVGEPEDEELGYTYNNRYTRHSVTDAIQLAETLYARDEA